jgi:hypothetical protein
MPSVKLHADKYEQMIARRGRVVRWREAIVCSCWNLDSGQPAYSCPACYGLGYTYEDPQEEKVLLMSIAHSKGYEEMAGLFEIGDAVLVVPKRVFEVIPNPTNTSGVETLRYTRDNPVFEVGQFDIITVLDDEYKTSEIIQKGIPMYGRLADTLINEDVTEVRKVRRTSLEEGKVYEYDKGVDFEVERNRIVWKEDGNQPSEGEKYSVLYTHRPSFTVLTQLPEQRYQDGQDLPKKVVLRQRAWGLNNKPNSPGGGLFVNEPNHY